MISYEDFTKVDIRVGRVVEIQEFPEARKPAYQFTIDFGSEIGLKRSSAQAVGAHTKEELLGKLVCCVVNFPPKKVANFESEVLTLGFKNAKGDGWVLITAMNENVDLGSRLQ
jgi:tRNA-binding protein